MSFIYEIFTKTFVFFLCISNYLNFQQSKSLPYIFLEHVSRRMIDIFKNHRNFEGLIENNNRMTHTV